MTDPNSSQVTDNAELAAMHAADQDGRQDVPQPNDPAYKEFWAKLTAADQERRQRARVLLQAGAVQTGNDYFRCAMIFQHSTEKQDYVLAHVLATAAGFKGHPMGKWLSAAALDRFLLTVGPLQLFGTQYLFDEKGGLVLSDVADLPDSVRAEFCVRPVDNRPPSGGSFLG